MDVELSTIMETIGWWLKECGTWGLKSAEETICAR